MFKTASPGSLTSYVRIKTVVGEVAPVYNDALTLRKTVFCGEQSVAVEEEIDGKDAVALHFVAYLDAGAFEYHQEQMRIAERLTASSGVAVRYTHRSKAEVDAMEGRPVKYKPPTLKPIGAMRMRRVSACSHLGNLNMMVAKVERLCVLKEYRRSGAGEMLLQAAKAAKDAFHIPWVMLHAPVHAKSFYHQRGYIACSEEFLHANTPHVVMVRNLLTDDIKPAGVKAENPLSKI